MRIERNEVCTLRTHVKHVLWRVKTQPARQMLLGVPQRVVNILGWKEGVGSVHILECNRVYVNHRRRM